MHARVGGVYPFFKVLELLPRGLLSVSDHLLTNNLTECANVQVLSRVNGTVRVFWLTSRARACAKRADLICVWVWVWVYSRMIRGEGCF
jgi:hypothetical protein